MPQLYLSLTVLENLVLALAIRAGGRAVLGAPRARRSARRGRAAVLEEFD